MKKGRPIMSYFKKWIGDVDLSKDLLLLLIIGGLYSLSVALSNTFVNIYLWKQSEDYVDLGLYNLAVVVFQPLTFILAGRWAKKVDRVIVLRMGVSFLAIFYTTVLLVGEKASQFIFLLGALLGIGYGFYWLAFNVLTFEITEPETRDFFNGFTGVLSSSGGMIGPIASGYIISNLSEFTGYTIIFSLSLGLFILAVILSFFLQRRPASGRYLFIRIIKERQFNKNWKYITNAHFFQGLREGTFVFVISVFVYLSSGSEMGLGTYGLINSAISFLGYYIISRIIKTKHRKRSILIGGVLLYAAIFLIVFDVSYAKLLLYGGIIAIAYPTLLVPYISMTYDVIGTGWRAAEMRIEYIVVREIFLNCGRIVSILSFLFTIHLFNPTEGLPFLLMILGAGHLIIYFCVRKVQFQST